jgi:hypothetical protein
MTEGLSPRRLTAPLYAQYPSVYGLNWMQKKYGSINILLHIADSILYLVPTQFQESILST